MKVWTAYKIVEPDERQILNFDYTNDKGEVSERSVIPNEIFFESLVALEQKNNKFYKLILFDYLNIRFLYA